MSIERVVIGLLCLAVLLLALWVLRCLSSIQILKDEKSVFANLVSIAAAEHEEMRGTHYPRYWTEEIKRILSARGWGISQFRLDEERFKILVTQCETRRHEGIRAERMEIAENKLELLTDVEAENPLRSVEEIKKAANDPEFGFPLNEIGTSVESLNYLLKENSIQRAASCAEQIKQLQRSSTSVEDIQRLSQQMTTFLHEGRITPQDAGIDMDALGEVVLGMVFNKLAPKGTQQEQSS
jgi:hypothetical protein